MKDFVLILLFVLGWGCGVAGAARGGLSRTKPVCDCLLRGAEHKTENEHGDASEPAQGAADRTASVRLVDEAKALDGDVERMDRDGVRLFFWKDVTVDETAFDETEREVFVGDGDGERASLVSDAILKDGSDALVGSAYGVDFHGGDYSTAGIAAQGIARLQAAHQDEKEVR